MKCAYCGEEKKATREHIISSGVLDLFPECYLTYDEHRGIIHGADPFVKDTCSECNHDRISYIDKYGKQFIEKYFLENYEKDAIVKIEYNYSMMQKLLLKYAYNDLRSKKDDISFFDNNILDFLKDGNDNKPLTNITILGGLAIDTTPVPGFMFGNKKLRWCKSPKFLLNSFVENFDMETGIIYLRKNVEFAKFDGLLLSYMFRFNSGQFILLCWDEEAGGLVENLDIIKNSYSYIILNQLESSARLFRCTNETTYHLFGYIETSFEDSMMDAISRMRYKASSSGRYYLDRLNEEWAKEEILLSKEHERKHK